MASATISWGRMKNADILLLGRRSCPGYWVLGGDGGALCFCCSILACTLYLAEDGRKEWCWFWYYKHLPFLQNFCNFAEEAFLHLLLALRTICKGFQCFYSIQQFYWGVGQQSSLHSHVRNSSLIICCFKLLEFGIICYLVTGDFYSRLKDIYSYNCDT